jgi:hypothetical protein
LHIEQPEFFSQVLLAFLDRLTHYMNHREVKEI